MRMARRSFFGDLADDDDPSASETVTFPISAYLIEGPDGHVPLRHGVSSRCHETARSMVRLLQATVPLVARTGRRGVSPAQAPGAARAGAGRHRARGPLAHARRSRRLRGVLSKIPGHRPPRRARRCTRVSPAPRFGQLVCVEGYGPVASQGHELAPCRESRAGAVPDRYGHSAQLGRGSRGGHAGTRRVAGRDGPRDPRVRRCLHHGELRPARATRRISGIRGQCGPHRRGNPRPAPNA